MQILRIDVATSEARSWPLHLPLWVKLVYGQEVSVSPCLRIRVGCSREVFAPGSRTVVGMSAPQPPGTFRRAHRDQLLYCEYHRVLHCSCLSCVAWRGWYICPYPVVCKFRAWSDRASGCEPYIFKSRPLGIKTRCAATATLACCGGLVSGTPCHRHRTVGLRPQSLAIHVMVLVLRRCHLLAR